MSPSRPYIVVRQSLNVATLSPGFGSMIPKNFNGIGGGGGGSGGPPEFSPGRLPPGFGLVAIGGGAGGGGGGGFPWTLKDWRWPAVARRSRARGIPPRFPERG